MLLILTGTIIPLTVFPVGVQEGLKLLPITNGLAAIREAFTGISLSEISGNILREILTGMVYFAVGYAGFLLFERVAKRRGTLELEAF